MKDPMKIISVLLAATGFLIPYLPDELSNGHMFIQIAFYGVAVYSWESS